MSTQPRPVLASKTNYSKFKTHQHREMVSIPRGQIGRQRDQVEIEPLDELLARAVPRCAHGHHVILTVERGDEEQTAGITAR